MQSFWKYKADHVIFWLTAVAFHVYLHVNLIQSAGWGQFVLEVIVRNVLLAALIYTHLLVLIPRLAQQRKIPAYIVSLLISILVYAFLKNAHDVYLYGNILGDATRKNFFYHTYYNISIAVFYLAFSAALRLSKEWYVQRERMREMEMEKINTELEYLKAQINPHFLFNSINTIFFQIDKQNVTARETLSRFSDMLRYQLYECNEKEIPIEKEVAYLRNYVNLQRARKDDNYNITFTCDEHVKDFRVAPLIMIPFVENAFKHVSNYTDRNNEIVIALELHNNFFSLQVKNTREHINGKEKGGIGLKNVKRRLDLLYNGRHTLLVNEQEGIYEIKLEIAAG
ncbi:MAG TPA: histidine kinase [Ohtaekwangia sp.]|uniref:sensor histidine kinase n=1 Tax=Ohtaekwangia sp. TaxID=2066019 RepID=UPI002F92CC3A